MSKFPGKRDENSENDESDQIRNGILNLNTQNIDQIGQFITPEKIIILNLSQNNIQKIQNLEKLKNLKELNLAHNNIDDFEGLDACKSLEILNLSHNSIETLEFIPKINGLNDLNLNKNNLKNLKGWENLKDLKKFKASSNKIKEIPFLPNSNKFEELVLFDNKIENIHQNTFEYGGSIVFLDLSRNFIKKTNFLAPLKNIQTIILSKNLIEAMDENLRLEKLENLDLSENFISETRGFENMFPSLFTLDLSSNRLLSLFELKFCGELQYLYDLNVSNNDFCNEETEKEIIDTYHNLERLNQKKIKQIGTNIEEMIKELENDLKTNENYNEMGNVVFDNSDSENGSKDENLRNLSKLKNPLSSTLKIESELELENQISVFKQFLQKATSDIENLRNVYNTRIGKHKIKDVQRRSLQKSFHATTTKNDENEENKTTNDDDDQMNKSMPNFKKFIVRKSKNLSNVPRSSSNSNKPMIIEKEKIIQTHTITNGFPLNPLNVAPKILQMSEKKIVKKLITTNTRDEKFIEQLRENLELNGNFSASKNKNRTLKAVPFVYKSSWKKI